MAGRPRNYFQIRPEDHLDNLLAIGNQLVPFTYPKVDVALDSDTTPLRQRRMLVDGYDVIVRYARADLGDHHLDSVHVVGAEAPFLPVGVSLKIARWFMGGNDLVLTEGILKAGKVYMWHQRVDRRGRPIEYDPQLGKACECDGVNYLLMRNGEIDLGPG